MAKPQFDPQVFNRALRAKLRAAGVTGKRADQAVLAAARERYEAEQAAIRALSDRTAPTAPVALNEHDPFVQAMRRNLSAARVPTAKHDGIIRGAIAARGAK